MRSATLRGVAASIALASVVVACGSGTPATNATTTTSTTSVSGERPATTAQIQIVKPAPNDVVVGSTVDVTIELTGAKVVPQTSGPIRSDEGHLHLSLDGRIVSMTFGTTDQITDVAPGQHSLQAEFVAADHAPFANKVVAAVLFTVQ